MKLFTCQNCNHNVFFENTHCESCGASLGFIPEYQTLSALQPAGGDDYNALATQDDSRWRYCANHQHEVCNWMVDASQNSEFCSACELNRYIPNLNTDQQHEAWRELETAKHRLVYSLLRFNLPLVSKLENAETGLAFDFVSEKDAIPEEAETLTGHADGQVTINASEADPVERTKMQQDMEESYRTLLGHFRHEVGHYYWDRLIGTSDERTQEFRALFGDETASYADALQQHYESGPSADWPQQFVSAYAASHPWEDWAETWAHYFHIVDTLETAASFGLTLNPPQGSGLAMKADIDPYAVADFDVILDRYLPMSMAVNSFNRSMGQPDLYPFVLPDPVRTKLGFIHRLLNQPQEC